MAIYTISLEAWKKIMDEACKADWKKHLERMESDPIYKKQQEELMEEYDRVFGTINSEKS